MTSPLLKELTALQNYILAAQELIKSGTMPDMQGFEKRVAFLCKSIQKESPEVQIQCRTGLATVLDCLNQCDETLRIWKGQQP